MTQEEVAERAQSHNGTARKHDQTEDRSWMREEEKTAREGESRFENFPKGCWKLGGSQ